MMRYTIVWDYEVELSLAKAWVAGDSQMRAVLTEIADWIDTSLGKSAEHKGQPPS